jgi:beta-lactamase regulating signal transducer with metallopeptidase domain
MSEILVNSILQASLISSIGIVLINALKKNILNKYTKTFNYYIWIVIVLKMLIPFKIPIYISNTIYNTFISSSKINNKYDYTLTYSINKESYFFKIVFFLWITGFLMLMIYHIYNYLNFISKVKHLAYNIKDNNINKLYLNLLNELNIKQNISLKYCKGIDSPLGIGIFKPLILLPIETYDIKELKWILKHELIHFKRHDLYYKTITMIAVTIYWFNPLVYIMNKAINHDCELACDEFLLKNSNIESRKTYAMTFVKSLKLNKKNKITTNIITGFNNNQKILKRRVENMLSLKKRKKGIVIGVLVAVIALTSFISIKTFAQGNKAQESIAVNTNNKNNKTNIKPNKTTGEILQYRGLAKNVPEKYIFNSKIREQLKKIPNEVIVIEGREQ